MKNDGAIASANVHDQCRMSLCPPSSPAIPRGMPASATGRTSMTPMLSPQWMAVSSKHLLQLLDYPLCQPERQDMGPQYPLRHLSGPGGGRADLNAAQIRTSWPPTPATPINCLQQQPGLPSGLLSATKLPGLLRRAARPSPPIPSMAMTATMPLWSCGPWSPPGSPSPVAWWAVQCTPASPLSTTMTATASWTPASL